MDSIEIGGSEALQRREGLGFLVLSPYANGPPKPEKRRVHRRRSKSESTSYTPRPKFQKNGVVGEGLWVCIPQRGVATGQICY